MFLIALGVAGLIAGFGGGEVRRFENAAAREIASKLEGSDRKVKVRTKFDIFAAMGGRVKSATITASQFSTPGLPLFTNPQASQRGRLDELKLNLSDFSLNGLQIRKLEARIPGCRFDLGLATRHRKIRLSRSGEGYGWVEIEQAALTAFVLKKFREIKRVTIRLENDRAFVEGYGEFLIFNTNFAVEARLTSPDGNRLVLTDAKITFDGREADEASRDVLLQTLNPVVDLDADLKLHGAISVQKLDLRNGILKAEGKTKIPDEPLGTKDALQTLTNIRWLSFCFRVS